MCYSSVKQHYPDNSTKNKEKNISHGVSKPNIQTFTAQSINVQAQSMDKLTEQKKQQDRHNIPAKGTFYILFSLGCFSFFTSPVASSTKS